MIKTIKLPAPELSKLKEVTVDLEMNGEHYIQLATCEGKLPEEVVLSILKDLVKEDANELTLAEARYIFMMVKINSLEDNLYANVQCTHVVNGKPCEHENHFHIRLSDADLHSTPKHYKIPTCEIVVEKEKKEFKVIPPSIKTEVSIFDWFLTTKGIAPEDLFENKELSVAYGWLRALCHLVDVNSNEPLIDGEKFKFENAEDCMKENKFSTILDLNKKVDEVDSFGVQNQKYTFECEECGGKLTFQIPLLYGLSL